MALSWWTGAVVLAVVARAGAVSPDSLLFPRPPSLGPAVAFWKQVFSAYGTDQALLHDNEDLSLVYAIEPLGSRAETGRDAQRRQAQEAALLRYQQALERLAAGIGDTALLAGPERQVWLALGRSPERSGYLRARERLRLQVGQQDRFDEGWQVWARHGERIRRILRGHGVPDALAVLPFVESMYNARARSHAGAVGLWQITRPAGRRFLRIDDLVDERLDPLKATHAAAQILLHNRQVLGNWPLAITAYNHGTAGVARAVREVGSREIAVLVSQYRGPAFGFASRNFYAEFLAALELVHQRQRRVGQQVLAAAGLPLEGWAGIDSEATGAGSTPAGAGSATAGAAPHPAAPESLLTAHLPALGDTALPPRAGPDSADVAPQVRPADVVVGTRRPASATYGWWQVARVVVAPLRTWPAGHLQACVALFEWVEEWRRALAALAAPLRS